MEYVQTERGEEHVIPLPNYFKHCGKYNSDAVWMNTHHEPTVQERLAQLEARLAELEARLS
jgi:hypothetical protein